VSKSYKAIIKRVPEAGADSRFRAARFPGVADPVQFMKGRQEVLESLVRTLRAALRAEAHPVSTADDRPALMEGEPLRSAAFEVLPRD